MARPGATILQPLENGGSREAAVDGSTVAKEFTWTCLEDSAFINRLIVFIQGSGTPGWTAETYANRAALTNGVKVEIKDASDNVLLDLLAGYTIKTDGEWKAKCHDWLPQDFGSGDEVASVRWTWGQTGEAVELKAGDKVVVTVQDDLTDLTHHWFEIQGVQT